MKALLLLILILTSFVLFAQVNRKPEKVNEVFLRSANITNHKDHKVYVWYFLSEHGFILRETRTQSLADLDDFLLKIGKNKGAIELNSKKSVTIDLITDEFGALGVSLSGDFNQ